MISKLTLSIDDKIIASAKKYAGKKGKSLSAIIENYLKSLSSKEVENNDISSEVSKMRGVISLPPNKTNRDILSEEISKKHAL